jgi:predicted SnoaL-like aldol condensation-catalyzing enzyme
VHPCSKTDAFCGRCSKPTAFFDLFRVDNGKIAEHWDVMADIPAKMALGNGKF